MSRFFTKVSLALLAAYALSGFYVVGGNEKAAVRRFGRLQTPLVASGLHYDWPFPFTSIDRINLAAVRTVTLGSTHMSDSTDLTAASSSAGALLTGDQNLLQVRAQVAYRPSEARIADFLFAQASAEARLKLLAESTLVELLSHSGVDFAHVRGLAELNDRLTTRLRSAAAEQRLGIEIEQAILEQVEPPLRVKADFLDVSNARAEQARSVQEARTWAEQRAAQADAECRRIANAAAADRRARVAAASGGADRFRQLVTQMRSEARDTGGDYGHIRRLAIQRMSWETLAEIWPKIRKKTIVDADGPVDVSVWPKGR